MSHQLFIRRLMAGCIAFVALTQAMVKAMDPTADDLIRSSRSVSSNDPACRSIEMEGYIEHGDVQLRAAVRFYWRAIYRAPNQFGLFLYHGNDRTPILVAAEGKAFIYDPTWPAALFFSGAVPRVEIRVTNDTLKAGFCAGSEEPEVTCDIKSFLWGQQKDVTIDRNFNGTNRLSLTTLVGNYCVANFSESRPFICSRLDVLMRDEVSPIFSISKIIVDGEIADKDFAFPTKEQLSKVIRVQEMKIDGSDFLIDISSRVTLSIAVRSAIHDPKLRKNHQGIDWYQVEKNDKVYSKALRELVAEPAK